MSYTVEQIKTLKTRQLLKELRYSYRLWEKDCQPSMIAYRQQLKDELATREHIPNKIESKRIRKERIKKGK